MSQRRPLTRKLVYVIVLVALLLPNYYLSGPATYKSLDKVQEGNLMDTVEPGTGGALTQLRRKYGLTNQALGRVDPTSQTIKLALLGLRGIAANILWTKANEYKKKEDWTNMLATVETIFRLQPHFITVWRFQAWNVSYNVSVEWDDYRDRYYWVVQGIECLERGVRVNHDDPSLLYDNGWFISHKIGKSDEKTQFRRLFKLDEDFHKQYGRPTGERDNWVVGKSYYRKAERVLDYNPKRVYRGNSRLIFWSTPGLNNFYYAMALAEEGNLGDILESIWQLGEEEWSGTEMTKDGVPPLGEREIKYSLDDTIIIRLNHKEEWDQRRDELWEKLTALDPQLYDQLKTEREAQVTSVERQALEIPFEKRVGEQYQLAASAEQKLYIDPQEDLAMAMPEPLRQQALKLAEDYNRAKQIAQYHSNYRDIVNFIYWRTRAQAEQVYDARAARIAVRDARQAYRVDGDPLKAWQEYARCLEHWRVILEAFPALRDDTLTAEDLFEIVREYRRALRESGLEDAFPPAGYGLVSLQEVVDWPELMQQLTAGGETPLGRLWDGLPPLFQEEVKAYYPERFPEWREQLDLLAQLNRYLETERFAADVLESGILDQLSGKQAGTEADVTEADVTEADVIEAEVMDPDVTKTSRARDEALAEEGALAEELQDYLRLAGDDWALEQRALPLEEEAERLQRQANTLLDRAAKLRYQAETRRSRSDATAEDRQQADELAREADQLRQQAEANRKKAVESVDQAKTLRSQKQLSYSVRTVYNRRLLETLTEGVFQPADRKRFLLHKVITEHPGIASGQGLNTRPLTQAEAVPIRLPGAVQLNDPEVPGPDVPMSEIPGSSEPSTSQTGSGETGSGKTESGAATGSQVDQQVDAQPASSETLPEDQPMSPTPGAG